MPRASADACDLYQIITGIFGEHEVLKEMGAAVSDVTNCNGTCPTGRHEFQIRLNEDAKWRYMKLVLNIRAGPTPREV